MLVRLKAEHPGQYTKEYVDGVGYRVEKRWREFDDSLYSVFSKSSALEFQNAPVKTAPRVSEPVKKSEVKEEKSFIRSRKTLE